MIRHRTPLVVALALATAAPIVAHSAPAAADGVRVQVDGRVRVRVAVPGTRRVYRVRVRRAPRVYVRPFYVAGGIYVGPRFAPPPPPVPVDDCDCGGPPGAVAPTVVATAPPPPPRREPRFALGLAGSHFDVDDSTESAELALLARLRVSRRWELEVEAGRAEADDSARIDRRLGVASYFHFAPAARLSPYLVAGLGVSRADFDGLEVDQGYGELGAGLTWRVNRRFHLAADFRGGVRGLDDADKDDEDFVRLVGPDALVDDEEEYTRFRLVGLVYF